MEKLTQPQYPYSIIASMKLGANPPKTRPKREVRLEACTLCQINCETCYMRQWNYCGLKAGYLSFANFAKFLKLNPEVTDIELSNSGEIFLNPDLLKIIKLAYEKGVLLTAYNGVNFNTVSDEVLEGLVKYRFGTFTISLDGYDQASYGSYRQGANFNNVINNIERLNFYKEKYKSYFSPHIVWKYVIIKATDSYHGIRKMKALAKKIGINEVRFAADWGGYIPKNLAMIKRETKLDYSQKSTADNNSKHSNRWCYQLWNSPQINWDGRFFGCCQNADWPFDGKLFETPLRDFLNSDQMLRTKKMLSGGEYDPKLPCANCKFYQTMRSEGNFFKLSELEKNIQDSSQMIENRYLKKMQKDLAHLAPNLPLVIKDHLEKSLR